MSLQTKVQLLWSACARVGAADTSMKPMDENLATNALTRSRSPARSRLCLRTDGCNAAAESLLIAKLANAIKVHAHVRFLKEFVAIQARCHQSRPARSHRLPLAAPRTCSAATRSYGTSNGRAMGMARPAGPFTTQHKLSLITPLHSDHSTPLQQPLPSPPLPFLQLFFFPGTGILGPSEPNFEAGLSEYFPFFSIDSR